MVPPLLPSRSRTRLLSPASIGMLLIAFRKSLPYLQLLALRLAPVVIERKKEAFSLNSEIGSESHFATMMVIEVIEEAVFFLKYLSFFSYKGF